MPWRHNGLSAMAIEGLGQIRIGTGLHLHADAAAGDLAGHSRDGDQIVFAQPAAGEGVGYQQLQLTAFESGAAGGPDPGFKGWFGKVALERFLNLTPQRFALLHRHTNPPGPRI